MGDPDIILGGLTFLLMCLGIGTMVVMIRWSAWRFSARRLHSGLAVARLGSLEPDARGKAIEAYRQLASEKLDVLKTALAMGYSDEQLRQLDCRLEELIGSDALRELVSGDSPFDGARLHERNIEAELRSMRRAVEG